MEGIRPSDVARLMSESAAEIGWACEDQSPRMHMHDRGSDGYKGQPTPQPSNYCGVYG